MSHKNHSVKASVEFLLQHFPAVVVEGIFLWRRIPSWQNNDMKSHPQFGKIWETFIAEQLIRQFTNQSERLDYYYYRTQNQA